MSTETPIPPQNVEPLAPSKGRDTLFWILIVLVVLGLGAWWWWMRQEAQKPVDEPVEEFRVVNAETPSPRRQMADNRSAMESRLARNEEQEDANRQTLAAQMIAEQMAREDQAKERRRSEDQAKAEQEANRRQQMIEKRRRSRLVVIRGGEYVQDAPEAPGSAPASGMDQASALAAMLQPAPVQEQSRAFSFVPKPEAAFISSAAVSPVRPDLSRFLGAGKLIGAVLETGIDSSRPGIVRAVVAEDVFSDDGSVILLPRGSKLLGEFQSANVAGQHRVGVIWNRAMRSDGVAVPLVSPGADALGTTGVPGKVNYHFWERFGAALLFSMIDAAASKERSNGNDAVLIESGSNAAGPAQQVANIPPTVRVRPGARVSAILARDLDFGAVAVFVP